MKYDFEIKEISRFGSTELVQTYHYSKIMPRLTKHFLGCFLKDELVGALTLGWGTQPKATIAKLFDGLDTVWGFIRSFMNRPPGDYETEVCDIRLKDKKYNEALEAANTALEKTPNHRGAVMCKALVFISQKKYLEANEELTNLINFLEKNVNEDDKTGIGTLAAAYANRGIIKDRNKDYKGALQDYTTRDRIIY